MAVVGQLVFIVIELGGQIPLGDIAALDGIPVFVPAVEIIPAMSEARLRAELSVGGQEHLTAADELGTALPRRLDRAFEDGELGLAVAPGVEPVEALLKNIERGTGSMDFKGFFFLEGVDAQVNVAAQEMEANPIVTASGQVGEFNECSRIHPKVVLTAETDLRATLFGFDLVTLDDGQVDHSRFRPEAAGPLDDNISFEVGQPDKAPAVIILVLGESAERQESQDRCQQDCLFHLRSPCTLD